MKYRFLDTIKDSIAICANLAVVITLLYVALGTTGVAPSALKTCTLVLFCFLLYVQRVYIDKLPLFLLCHIVTYVLAFLACKGSVKETVIYALVFFIIFTVSFAQRIGSETPGRDIVNPFLAGGIMLGAFILLEYLHHDDIIKLLPKYEVCYGALFLINYYMQNFLWNDSMNRKFMANVPTGRLFKTGAPYAFGIGAFYALLSGLMVNFEKIQRIAEWIKNLIRNFLIWIFSKIPKDLGEYEGDNSAKETISPESLIDMDPTVGETPVIWIILQKIFEYITAIIVITGVIVLLVYAVVTIIKRFHGADKRKTFVETDYVEEKEKISRNTERASEGIKLPFFRKPSEKIRRLYVAIALRNKEIIERPGYVTPRDMAECFPDEKKPAAYKFMMLYEKARFSPREVTSQDAKEAKVYADLL